MNKIWHIGDLHFHHTQIIDYCDRPFLNVYEMNKTLIENWNNTVKQGHIIYVHGDVSFVGREGTKKIIQQLNGNKILIMGNHDRGKSVDFWLDVGFKQVYQYPIIVNNNYIYCHEPIITNEFKVVHAHTHNIPTGFSPDSHFCVSAELTNYKPISNDKILEHFNIKGRC